MYDAIIAMAAVAQGMGMYLAHQLCEKNVIGSNANKNHVHNLNDAFESIIKIMEHKNIMKKKNPKPMVLESAEG